MSKCKMSTAQLKVLTDYIDSRIMMALRNHKGTATRADVKEFLDATQRLEDTFVVEGVEVEQGPISVPYITADSFWVEDGNGKVLVGTRKGDPDA